MLCVSVCVCAHTCVYVFLSGSCDLSAPEPQRRVSARRQEARVCPGLTAISRGSLAPSALETVLWEVQSWASSGQLLNQ